MYLLFNFFYGNFSTNLVYSGIVLGANFEGNKVTPRG